MSIITVESRYCRPCKQRDYTARKLHSTKIFQIESDELYGSTLEVSCKSHLDLGLVRDVLDLTRTLVGGDLDITSLDITLELVKTRLNLTGLPRLDAAIEYSVHFFESLALRLRSCQEHVNQSQAIEGTEDLNTLLAMCRDSRASANLPCTSSS